MDSSALSYHEPGIVTILILSSFLLFLNIINYVLDGIVYCGLIGQILIGVAWGKPGANWLAAEVQNAVMQLGYIGLILLVYEGGLSTHLKTLRANFFISGLVATIGISCPIALSFVLLRMLDITLLQAFASGAALCSTSLGTTFTVLSTSGLSDSRLGVVLSSAAMMDDVVGLIMVKVVEVLGKSTSSFSAITVVRPIFVSVAFAVLLPPICLWIAKPLTLHFTRKMKDSNRPSLQATLSSRGAVLALHTTVLLAMVTGSTYAWTSNLFAAYLAGLVNTWWSELPSDLENAEQPSEWHSDEKQEVVAENGDRAALPASGPNTASREADEDACIPLDGSPVDTAACASTHEATPPHSGLGEVSQRSETSQTSAIAIYDHYYAPAVASVLKPFFFASIGFSIPVTQMFAASIVWRGFIYAALMTFGKMLCGVCLIRFSLPSLSSVMPRNIHSILRKASSCWPRAKKTTTQSTATSTSIAATRSRPATDSLLAVGQQATSAPSSKPLRLNKPRSLYPPAMLGMAMVARGEIGFLISAVAESSGVYRSGSESDGSSELFLVVTWAILLCTILGPLSVGVLVKRVRRLQERERSERTGKGDPLGVWGFVQTTS